MSTIIPPKDTVPHIDPDLVDFRNFLYLVWKHLQLPDPTKVQYDIAHYLQHGPRRRIVEAFRGVGKSWITAAFVIHQLYLDPQKKVEVVSASKNLADNFSTFCLQLINSMEILEHLKPRDDQRNSKIQFDVGPARDSKDPSVKSVGITGQLTGTRADLIVADDVEAPGNSLTQGGREKLAEAVKEFDAILKPDGDIIYLGTPQTEMSLYNVLKTRDYHPRIWPARYPNENELVAYGSVLSPLIRDAVESNPRLTGRSVEPSRFTDLDLLQRETSYGRSGFALQFMLDTSLSDALRYPLKLSDLVVMDVDAAVAPERIVWASNRDLEWSDLPNVGFNGDRYYRPFATTGQWVDYQGTVMFIDPAGRGKDETGYAVVSMMGGYLFLKASGGLSGGYTPANLEFLANTAKAHKVTWLRIESNFGDGMFLSLLQPVLTKIHPVTCDEVRSNRQKELRIIDTLEPVMNSHRLIVDRKVIQRDFESTQGLLNESSESRLGYQLFYQMSRVTKEKGALGHDDRLDALAGAVAYWTEQMSVDQQRQIDARKEDMLDATLKDFINNVFGNKQTTSNSWINLAG